MSNSPFYEFSPEDIKFISSDVKPEEIATLLRRFNIIQYFFPALDQLALGLVARTSPSRTQLNKLLTIPPKLGHPYGSTEIIDKTVLLTDVIDALQDRKLIVSGKISYELTPSGESIRKEICFKARESLVSKIISRFRIAIDIKKLFL